MKTSNQIIDDLDALIREMENFKHSIAFIKADNKLTEYDKINKSRKVLRNVFDNTSIMADEIAKWLSFVRNSHDNSVELQNKTV